MGDSIREELLEFFDPNALDDGLREAKDRSSSLHDDYELVSELAEYYKHLKSQQVLQKSEYLPGGEWLVHTTSRTRLYKALLDGEIEEASSLLRNFWRNELGVIVKEHATFESLMQPGNLKSDFAEKMAHDIVIWKNLYNRPFRVLATPQVGNPWGYKWEGVVIAPKAMRYDALAVQTMLLLDEGADNVLVEIGAGYGGFAHALFTSGYKGTYVNFDLPETLVVAAYFLRKALPEKNIQLHDGEAMDWETQFSAWDLILSPNWAIDSLERNSVDMVINTFSLSEMPFTVMSNYIQVISRICKSFFLHNNMDRKGVVNQGYERTPASEFPVPEADFQLLYKRYDLFQRLHSGRNGDYREYLYQRRPKPAFTIG